MSSRRPDLKDKNIAARKRARSESSKEAQKALSRIHSAKKSAMDAWFKTLSLKKKEAIHAAWSEFQSNKTKRCQT
jgi:hypothetical protein